MIVITDNLLEEKYLDDLSPKKNRYQIEVEQARARARRPQPNFWLTVNKPQAWGLTSLIFRKAWSRAIFDFMLVESSGSKQGLSSARAKKNWACSTSSNNPVLTSILWQGYRLVTTAFWKDDLFIFQGHVLRPGLRGPVPSAADRGPLQGLVQHLRLALRLLRRHVRQAGRWREAGPPPALDQVPPIQRRNTRTGTEGLSLSLSLGLGLVLV